jgi:hypothetical protein
MKHARGFFLALAILIMPNAAYYVFNWILVLKRQINEENFLRLPLYVDYIPEAIILVAMCLLIIYAVKDFTRAGKYGYMAAPTILLTNLAINSVVFMSIGMPQYFGMGYMMFQWYRAVVWFFIIGSTLYGITAKKK